ncbi:MAG: DUF421 domain-containing protein [Bacillota bacterium]
MSEILNTAIRTLIGFAILLLFTRLTGKKQLSQMTIFTYITGITLGSMVGEMVIHGGVEFWEEIVGVVLWGVFSFVVEYIGLKIPFMRVVLDSEPTIVIKRGEIQIKELRKMRLNMDDLTMLLREKDVFTVRDVWYAILEPHGELSIVKTAAKQSVLMENIGLQPQNLSHLPGELITDGKLITKNLLEFGKTEAWLAQELSKQGITSIKQVFYAEFCEDDTLFIQKNDYYSK